eukprot:6311647-Prymnesium_polylepis.1
MGHRPPCVPVVSMNFRISELRCPPRMPSVEGMSRGSPPRIARCAAVDAEPGVCVFTPPSGPNGPPALRSSGASSGEPA